MWGEHEQGLAQEKLQWRPAGRFGTPLPLLAAGGRSLIPQPPPHVVLLTAASPPGLSNIIGIIVYISANAGDPSKSDSKKNSYSYGWSFYFGALSFIIAEMVGVLAVHMFIDRHKQLRANARATDYLQSSAITRIPSYRYRYQSAAAPAPAPPSLHTPGMPLPSGSKGSTPSHQQRSRCTP